MNFNFVFFSFILMCVNRGRGDGFLTKLFNKGKNNKNDQVQNEIDVCETVRTMPRIALAVVGGLPMQNEISAPYIAAIGGKGTEGKVSWFCGGSLISSKDILTAAHCLVSRNATLIRVGSFSAKERLTGNDYGVSETIIHPSYKITESYHDIAVVKVKEKIGFTKYIKPVCLPENDRERYERERARVVGWGAEEFGGEGSQRLQQVEVEVFSNANCEKAYSNSTIGPKSFPRGIIKQQLCAGSSRGGKDACQGDSGGPLVLTDSNGIIRQIGVVSTGAGCGAKEFPGVYTRVSSYYDWIQEQIKKRDSNTDTRSPSKSSDNSNRRDQSSNNNGRSSQYRNDPSRGQSSQNHLPTHGNQRNQDKKYHSSREQNSEGMSHHNRPTESSYSSPRPAHNSGPQTSSHPAHSGVSTQHQPARSPHQSNFDGSSLLSQSGQSSHSHPTSHQTSRSHGPTHSSSSSPSSYHSGPRQSSPYEAQQSSRQSNYQEPRSSSSSSSASYPYQSQQTPRQEPPFQISRTSYQPTYQAPPSSPSFSSSSSSFPSSPYQPHPSPHQSINQEPPFQISRTSYQPIYQEPRSSSFLSSPPSQPQQSPRQEPPFEISQTPYQPTYQEPPSSSSSSAPSQPQESPHQEPPLQISRTSYQPTYQEPPSSLSSAASQPQQSPNQEPPLQISGRSYELTPQEPPSSSSSSQPQQSPHQSSSQEPPLQISSQVSLSSC